MTCPHVFPDRFLGTTTIARLTFWLCSLSSATNISARLLPDAGGDFNNKYCSPRNCQTWLCTARIPIPLGVIDLPLPAEMTLTPGIVLGLDSFIRYRFIPSEKAESDLGIAVLCESRRSRADSFQALQSWHGLMATTPRTQTHHLAESVRTNSLLVDETD